MESDSLRSVRNAYYLGLYSEVAKEVNQLPKEAQGQNNNDHYNERKTSQELIYERVNRRKW